MGRAHGPRLPVAPALANAQLLLSDLESWELPMLHILKGQSRSSLFCIHTEEKPKPYNPRPGFQEQIFGRMHQRY